MADQGITKDRNARSPHFPEWFPAWPQRSPTVLEDAADRRSRLHPPVVVISQVSDLGDADSRVARKTAHGESLLNRATRFPANSFHPVNIPTRPSPNTMRIFLKSVAMRSCEQM